MAARQEHWNQDKDNDMTAAEPWLGDPRQTRLTAAFFKAYEDAKCERLTTVVQLSADEAHNSGSAASRPDNKPATLPASQVHNQPICKAIPAENGVSAVRG